MKLSYKKKDNAAVVYLKGRIDIVQSQFIDREIETLIAMEPAGNFLFDLTEVEYINSYGLKVLFKTYLALKNQGRTLALCNINNTVRKLFQILTNIDDLAIFDSEEAGIAFLSRRGTGLKK